MWEDIKLARLLAREIDRAETWAPDTYRGHLPSGACIWVANGCSGLHVETPAGFRMWGVTMWCLVGGSPAQRIVWRAVQRRVRRELIAAEAA